MILRFWQKHSIDNFDGKLDFMVFAKQNMIKIGLLENQHIIFINLKIEF